MGMGFAAYTDKRTPILLMVFALVVVILLYQDTIASIVNTWRGSEAYLHGFLVLPICAYLVWQKRSALAEVPISRSFIGLVALALLSILWWISDFVGIQVMKQFSMVAMVPGVVLAIFGGRFTREIRFAFFYLIFAVPFGEFLIPYLIDFTASFTVDALNLVGIPVLRDGRYFHISTGSYEIAKACSGLNYMIATLALTTLYSHVLFKDARKALVFVGFAFILSVLGNGVRATIVVLLLHYTNLDISDGQDHEFVGWIIYGLMVGVLVWVGTRYQEPADEQIPKYRLRTDERATVERASSITVALTGASLLIALSTGHFLTLVGYQKSRPDNALTTGLPDQVDGWDALVPDNLEWSPDFSGYSQMSLGSYRHALESVDVALVRYLSQNQGEEVTNAINSVVDASEWSLGNVKQIELKINPSTTLPIQEVTANQSQTLRLIWYWTEVNGTPANGKMQTKVFEIRSLLAGESTISSAIIVSTPIKETEHDSRDILQRFLSAFYFELQKCVDSDMTDIHCSLGTPMAKES